MSTRPGRFRIGATKLGNAETGNDLTYPDITNTVLILIIFIKDYTFIGKNQETSGRVDNSIVTKSPIFNHPIFNDFLRHYNLLSTYMK